MLLAGRTHEGMTELEIIGTLDGIGLPGIVHFFVGLKKTGALRVELHDSHGEISFFRGQITGARLGSQTGLIALDAMAETMPGASFAFDSSPSAVSSGKTTIELGPDALRAHLDELSVRIGGDKRVLPSPEAVPVLLAPDDTGDGGDPVPLDRGTLQTLLLVDGRRTV